MSLSRREKGLAAGSLVVLGVLLFDYLALTPLMKQQADLETQRSQIMKDIRSAQKLLGERRELAPQWRKMNESGLKSDPAEAEGQLLHALRDWAQEAGLKLSSVKPDRPESKEQLREVHVLATGSGTIAAVTQFLWKVQSAPFPLKMLEFQLGSQTENVTDLPLQVKLSTLYSAPAQRGAKVEKAANGGAR